MKLTKKALLLLYSPSKCSFTLSKLIHNAWLFLLAARHRMQALSALACCVGCAFSGFASLKIALFIQLLTNVGDPLILMGHPHYLLNICFSVTVSTVGRTYREITFLSFQYHTPP